MADKFEDTIHKNLHQYLIGIGKVDERLPECPDVTDKWESIGGSYIPDGAREYRDYPVASLGWMMYIGMAVAKLWDDEWEIYSQIEDLHFAEDPLRTIARGTAVALKNFDTYPFLITI